MCGIFGIVGLSDADLGERLAACLHHRGPDDRGVWTSAAATPVTLVNTRLSIIDLSPAGHMPMSNEDGSAWIAYNGEMYSFGELRLELEQRGHVFRSHTDTEAILHAYEEWGADCLQRLRGMYAFLIWDARRQRLFAARDRLGIKPLYYAQAGGNLLLGSEIKAFLASGLIEPDLDLEALHHYLTFYAVPAPHTILKGVRALPAGHCLTFEAGRLDIQPYWDVPAAAPLQAPPAEIRAELRRLLEESTRLRMIADVPVGAFLSGGIDSSAVVGLMTRISGERLKTFSVGFESEGQRLDERGYAALVARRFDTDHHEVVVSGRDVRGQLDRIVQAMDQPTGDGLNTYFVSQAAAQQVKVALSGLGGDELFAGYPQFASLERAERVSWLWRLAPAGVRSAAGAGAAATAWVTGRSRLAEVPAWLDEDFLARYTRVRTLYDETAKARLYRRGLHSQASNGHGSQATLRPYLSPAETQVIDRVSRLELKGYMANTLLRDTDAMSMAHSLEVRVPLIDHKLVEFATRVPPALKLAGGRAKLLLVDAVRDLLPPEVIARPKRGFEMPVGHWLRNELRPVLDDLFEPQAVARRGLFDPGEVSRVYQSFLAGRGLYMRVWVLAALELWLRACLPGFSAA
jgi:asparagine synthase (glutamine-hydrolysing)